MDMVCLSVCPSCNSNKYSSNVLKLIYNIHILHSMNSIENGTYGTNGSSTETHKIFLYNATYEKKNFKAYLNLFALNIMVYRYISIDYHVSFRFIKASFLFKKINCEINSYFDNYLWILLVLAKLFHNYAKGSSTETHKIFRYIKAYGEKIFKMYFNRLL